MNVPRAGFTLIELSTALALIGLAAVLAWPSFRLLGRRWQDDACRAALEAALLEARERAMDTGADAAPAPARLPACGAASEAITFHANGAADVPASVPADLLPAWMRRP